MKTWFSMARLGMQRYFLQDDWRSVNQLLSMITVKAMVDSILRIMRVSRQAFC